MIHSMTLMRQLPAFSLDLGKIGVSVSFSAFVSSDFMALYKCCYYYDIVTSQMNEA